MAHGRLRRSCALISFGLLTLRAAEAGGRGPAYAAWTGIGAAGTAVVGHGGARRVGVRREARVAIGAWILAGVVGLNLSGVTPP